MSRSEVLGGGLGASPLEHFGKWCNLVRFGVYLDDFVFKNFKNLIFFK